ncbi:MAG: 50S ribosomal protein L22 [Candidatus Levybacteria bacterium]|nr:50S ribosomal protein L22 [Candidatus Levybacteria bacterium]
MEVVAKSKSVRISPRKIRLIADSIRNMEVKKALDSLSLLNKRGAIPLWKTLKSAVANAVNNAKLKEEGLFIKSIEVDGGPVLKRFRPSTRGRVHPYKKRASHIKITLEAHE